MCGSGTRERKKDIYIARNTSDSAIGVPAHFTYGGPGKCCRAVAPRYDAPTAKRYARSRGHFGFIASLTLHRSWKRREGYPAGYLYGLNARARITLMVLLY